MFFPFVEVRATGNEEEQRWVGFIRWHGYSQSVNHSCNGRTGTMCEQVRMGKVNERAEDEAAVYKAH